jgi:hypothetical protein
MLRFVARKIRKIVTSVAPSKALPGEAEAQVAAVKSILHTAIMRKKNVDPRKLLKWMESGMDFNEISDLPPTEIHTLSEKIQPQGKDCAILLTDEEIRDVSVIAEKRQEVFTAETSVKRIIAVRNYTECVQELVLRVNGFEYPENFNYWATKPVQDKVLEA